RDQEIKMAGFPHHQLESYLHKLLKEGLRVAVCDQVDSTMKQTRREITRVLTPGTTVEEHEPKAERRPRVNPPIPEERPIRQPRHFVLQRYQEFLNKTGLALVAVEDVKRTTPAVAPHVGSLDVIVLRGDEKLLVTVRPHLQPKHLKGIAELQK